MRMSSTESSSSEPGGTGPASGPARSPAALAAVTIALLAALVWALWPERPAFKPAPLKPLPAECPRLQREFVPSNITGFPNALLNGLTPREKNRALYRLNMEPCPCGCASSVAACRLNNPECPTSKELAERIIAEGRAEMGRAK